MSGSRRVMTAGQMGASAVPLSPADPGPALPVPAEPAPKVSDIASKQASNKGRNEQDTPPRGITFSAADLMRGLPDADADLVTVSVRIPRVLAELLDVESRMTRRPRQAIVADALWAHANPELVNEIHQRLYGKLYRGRS